MVISCTISDGEITSRKNPSAIAIGVAATTSPVKLIIFTLGVSGSGSSKVTTSRADLSPEAACVVVPVLMPRIVREKQ